MVRMVPQLQGHGYLAIEPWSKRNCARIYANMIILAPTSRAGYNLSSVSAIEFESWVCDPSGALVPRQMHWNSLRVHKFGATFFHRLVQGDLGFVYFQSSILRV